MIRMRTTDSGSAGVGIVIGVVATLLVFCLVIAAAIMRIASVVQDQCTPAIAPIVMPAADVVIDANGEITIDGITLSPEQQRNAGIIAGVGKSLGLSHRLIAIGIATAYQESRLRNVNYGDRDSLGLFQQRPSQGWGTPAQVLDPVYAANQFFKRLREVPGVETMPMIDAAMKVQRPNRTAYLSTWDWDAMALALTKRLLGTLPQVGLPVGPTPGFPGTGSDTGNPELTQVIDQGPGGCTGIGGNVTAAIEAAKSQVGKPYRWGGSTETGGFDCSGLMWWAYGQAGVELPRVSRDQFSAGTKVTRSDLLPGDLVYWSRDGTTAGVYHVAMWLGDNQIIEAPRTGRNVGVYPMRWDNFIGATRPVSADAVTPVGATLNGWQVPLRNTYRVSSNYGYRIHPIYGTRRLHAGIDLAAPAGTPIYAAAAGTVTQASWSGGYGNYTMIDHGQGISSAYGHQQRIAPGIRPGVRVTAGQLIGYVGSTGGSTGNHLHFEIRINGDPVDPVPFLQERGLRF